MTQYVQKLPAVFQTVTEKKFFDATFDQVFSKKDASLLAGYLGRRNPGSYNPISDFYIPEPSKNRTWWQLEATAYARNTDTTKDNIFFYEDLLERIQYYGGNVLNQDRLFESEYYSFGPPIDYDMFINYSNYYWVEQGLPSITITGVVAADIIGKSSYTTPNTATPANLTLSTGMTIILSDDASYSSPHVVENLGGCDGIILVPKFPDFTSGSVFEFLPWDGQLQLSNGRVIQNSRWDATTWDVEVQPGNSDYITIERGSLDRNAWSRTNKWFHIDTINATIAATGSSFPTNASRALRPIIQFVANLTLYKSGTQFRNSIDYGLRNNSFGNPVLLSTLSGQPVSILDTTYSINITTGKLFIFMNDTTAYGSLITNQYIFEATVQLDNTVTFAPYTAISTPIIDGDIIFINEDSPYDGAIRGQTWYFQNQVWQEAFNDKISVNQPPLFQLYDHNGITLDNTSTYPNSTFAGSKIFSYKVNTTPGATIDPVLKFPIVYTALGQSSDIIFENNLITDRYVYGPQLLSINGYYYYKTSTSPVTFNNWNLYDICECADIVSPPPCNCIEVSKQRVIDKFAVGYGSEFKFKLSVTPYGYPTSPDIIVSVNSTEIFNSTTQANGYTLEIINNRVYVDLTSYLTSLLTTPQTQPPVVEVQSYTHDLLDPAEPGYFAIPQQLEANPTQLEISEISGSNLIEQFSSIISNQIGFSGSSFGGSNNYRDSRKNRSLGQYILQNVSPALKSMLVSSSDDLDFISAVRFSNDEYTKFKNKYLTVALQLINQEFDPVTYQNNSVVISYWVGQILKTINISREFSDAFSYSYMAASGTPTHQETMSVVGNSLVTLTNYIDLSDPKNVLYVYDVTNPASETLLISGIDYTITSTNLAIDVQLNLGSGVKDLVFYLYSNPLPTYIPSTPSKLGTYPTYVPRIELDTTYAIPTNVIIGHDGSKTIAYGDYRDQLLLEIEKRIYNFIQEKFQNEYAIPLRIESIKSGYFRQTRYSRQEYLDITESYLNKWSAKYKANYRANDWSTANLTTPVSELWKLYNYRDAVTTLGVKANLPGNWKGIFQYYYDTYYPDTRPWEMLGFSQQPSWWITEYGSPVLNIAGQQVWTSTSAGLHNMWSDIEAGIIRQGPSAIYDPITLLPQSQPMWARPGLSSIIPVNTSGELIPIITLFGLAYTGNPYEPFDYFDIDWMYGDGGPVEQAWMSTSSYAYNIQEFLYLTRPSSFGELLFDTLGTELSPGMITISGIESPVMSNTNWQYVQNEQFTSSDKFFSWFRPKNSDQIVHAETVDGVVEIRFGYQAWISDRILFLGKNVADTFGQKIRTLDVNLANKLAGFTNKDTTNTYIESITPGASTNTLIIPSTNFDVILHKSPPVDTYSYSGVIIRALADGSFVVYGYDLLNAQFTTIDRSTEQLIDITIGGTPAEFRYFNIGDTYNQGDIVRYNGVYYVSLGTQSVQKFDPSSWQKLKTLPTVGGVSVSYKPISSETTTLIPYGTVFNTPQAVFDFLIGWGAYLESQGWQFKDVSPDTNQISDWLYSAKQFLFWLNTNWAPDASIQLSPLANSASLIVRRGYPDDVETLTNGVYSILNKNGIAIAPSNTNTDRSGPLITVSPVDLSVGGIYFLQVNASETEHVLIFDNTTSFNDVVYSPLLRARQQRLRFNGFRSNGWYGKMEAPGYLVIDNQLVPNYDTIVNSMRYYYDPNTVIDNPSLEDLGRHLIGYESKSYLDNLQVSNDVQYLFYQGAIRQKGTSQSFDKLFRSTKIQSNEIIKVYEEWALKLSDFGSTVEQVSTEFKLIPEQNTGEVIVARLNFVPSNIGFINQINILNAENTYSTVPKVVIPLPDATPSTSWTIFSNTSTYAVGSIVRYNDSQGNPVYYSSNIVQGPGPFNSANWTVVLETRIAKAYIVLDSSGLISRIDMIDPGYGYLTAPDIEINSGTESHSLDKLYSIWQGEIIKDTTLDNIVNIDIDQTDVWTVRPQDPSVTLEFPVTDIIDYPIPNAGYVNFDDVTFSVFDTIQTVSKWGIGNFNPLENNILWVAKTFTQDWNVYKLIDITASSTFDVILDANNNLMLRTDINYLINPQFSTSVGSGTTVNTDFGNLISLQVIEAHAIANVSAGAITDIIVTKTGANYDVIPNVIIVAVGGTATATATIAGGIVTGITINSQSGFITSATVTIDPPTIVGGSTNYSVGFEFNLIETSSDPTHNYYNLLTLDGNPISSTDIPEYANFTKLMLFKTMRFEVEPSVGTPSYVSVGDKIWVDGTNLVPQKWSVYDIVTPTISIPTGHKLFRQQTQLIDTHLFQSASVFNDSGIELVQLPIYDPFKNILPGPARQNISYMELQDPARYNVTGNTVLFSENINFGPNQVGQLWWDLSDTRFVYYEQPIALDGSETDIDNLKYRRDHWAQIFPGSTINIYEWVQSSVPPASYIGSGTPKDVTSYVQVITSNRFTNQTEINYYFWVLNATDKPNIENRTLAAIDVSNLLQSPKSQGFAFFSPIQQTSTNNSYMFYNVQEILAYQGDNVQVQYRIGLRDDQKHAQWSFFREGDSGSLVTDQFWNKMVDSLCGYTKLLPESNEYQGITIANNLPWDIYGWDIAPWDNATSSSVAYYGEILPVPDPTLSDGEKYGILYRPRQGMFVNLLSARKVFVQAANSLLQYIPIRDSNSLWNAGVETSDYWAYTNWYAVGYENSIPTVVYQTLTDANNALISGQLQVGTILQVTNGTIDGRYALYVVVQLNPNVSMLSLNEIGIENSAIKLLDTVYKTINKYGLSIELRELLNAFRTEIMINEYIVDQNELFFSMLNYVLSEQKNPNWVFKSSYIYIKEDNLPLSQDQLYAPDQIQNIIDYIVDAKPYHTQIRDYTSTYVTSDIAAGTAIDTITSNIILQFGPSYQGNLYYVPSNIADPMIGWDFNQAPYDSIPWDNTNISLVVNQFISRNPVLPTFDPGTGNPWPDTYTIPLTFFDASKMGYSQLYPYTFDFNSLNLDNPQSFITPYNVVAVQIGNNVLYYGRDYYVEYNNDTTYTIYFYSNPGTAITPIAFVWWNGGDIQFIPTSVVRPEIVNGTESQDNFVINVDTKLPVNDFSHYDPITSAPVFGGPITPYVATGEPWNPTGPVADIILAAGGTLTIGTPLNPNPPLLSNVISFKENVAISNIPAQNFYRNAEMWAGVLVYDLLAPNSTTYNTQSITVYVDPAIHTAGTDILPIPGAEPGVIWINGERIEYRDKQLVASNTWKLSLLNRGTNGTGICDHLAMIPSSYNPLVLVPNTVWVQEDNIMPSNSNINIWNAYSTLPSVNIYNGGLWYSQTIEALFLIEGQGKSIS